MKTKYFVALLFFFSCLAYSTTSTYAQIRSVKRMTIGKMRAMSQDGTSAVGTLAKEEMQSYEANLRKDAQNFKNDMPNRALSMFMPNDSSTGPKLIELIEDADARASISDRRNKERFLELVYEWWMLPSEVDLEERRRRLMEMWKTKMAPKSVYLHQKQINNNEVIVFSWHPSWYEKAYKMYHYDRVNVIAYYSYDIDPISGAPLNPLAVQDFVSGGFVKHVKETPRIKEYGNKTPADTSYAKVLLSVSLHGMENVDLFLSPGNMQAQQVVIDSVIALLDTTQTDGIELNILNVPPQLRAEYISFVARISQAVHTSNPDRLVFLSVPAFDPHDVYNFRDLTSIVDYFIVLALDFHNEIEQDTIIKHPVSPFNFNRADRTPDVRLAVEKTIRKMGTFNASRLLVAYPHYGMMWETQDATSVPVAKLSYDDIITNYVKAVDTNLAKLTLDKSRLTKVWTLTEKADSFSSPKRTEIYFDDVTTLREKYTYALDTRLGGVAIHMLGDVVQYNQDFNALLDEVFAEYKEPNITALAKINTWSDITQDYAPYVLAILLYWAIFMIIGFVLALFHRPTRQILFDNSRFRSLYLAFFVALLIMLGNYFGLFQYNIAVLIAGLVIGSFLSWAILKALYKQQDLQP